MIHIFSVIFISLAAFTVAFHTEEPGLDGLPIPADALPFYRAYNPAGVDHFYTANVNVLLFSTGNYPLQEVAALVFTKLDNFYTTWETERLDFIANQGYTEIEIAGYVLPLALTQC
ncbi:hypothetical protein B0H16DRAFT_1576995 [Mycena metata]|uniref:DUF5648 domain-containing protein n=1 Tax=Mycena metata TaxID=1033252 RepID=A0AAD7I679_9AGAR|nr:hypothetical protein B0H16DRAFT_1576995 [Mycena metata]